MRDCAGRAKGSLLTETLPTRPIPPPGGESMADRMRRDALAAIVLPVLLLAMPGLARAATLTVNNINDTGMGSLRGEILAASSGDTINFNVSGTIMLGSSLPAITIGLTIDGSGQSITVDGKNLFQILSVNAGATLHLQFLTLAHGFAIGNVGIGPGEVAGAGGAIVNNGTLTITNCTLLDNRVTGNSAGSSFSIGLPGGGGGIYNNGTLSVTDSTFTG